MTFNEQEAKDKKKIDEIYESVVQTSEYKQLTNVLSGLVNNLKSSETAKMHLKIYASALQKRFERSKHNLYFFKEDYWPQENEPATLGKAWRFLALHETSLTNAIDLILMIFIAVHHDLYNFFTRKYVQSLDDLDKISLNEKMLFLEHHKLRIFNHNVNRDLRNKIAHMDFEIAPEGKIVIRNKEYDLEEETYHLMGFTLCMAHSIADSGIPELLSELS
jgi:hypothetical protein